MGKPRLLVVEDDHDISNLLKFYFSKQDYEVDIASKGGEALEKTRQSLPHLIVLDIMLPDIDGFEVCRSLRTNLRTSHVPIIFLTQKEERIDRLKGLELGADDYITKPFDIEELKLRVQRAIQRSQQQSLTDPSSGLPSGKLIEDQLRRIIRLKDWVLIDFRINHFEDFKDMYGFVAGGDVIRFTGMLANEILDEFGTPDDFLGHAGGDNFIIITSQENSSKISQMLKNQFAEEAVLHYSFMDREQGYIQVPGKTEKVPFMTLAMGMVSPADYEFADIREITEIAAEIRRRDTGR
jgi:PleD family two-component response regulator